MLIEIFVHTSVTLKDAVHKSFHTLNVHAFSSSSLPSNGIE